MLDSNVSSYKSSRSSPSLLMLRTGGGGGGGGEGDGAKINSLYFSSGLKVLPRFQKAKAASKGRRDAVREALVGLIGESKQILSTTANGVGGVGAVGLHRRVGGGANTPLPAPTRRSFDDSWLGASFLDDSDYDSETKGGGSVCSLDGQSRRARRRRKDHKKTPRPRSVAPWDDVGGSAGWGDLAIPDRLVTLATTTDTSATDDAVHRSSFTSTTSVDRYKSKKEKDSLEDSPSSSSTAKKTIRHRQVNRSKSDTSGLLPSSSAPSLSSLKSPTRTRKLRDSGSSVGGLSPKTSKASLKSPTRSRKPTNKSGSGGGGVSPKSTSSSRKVLALSTLQPPQLSDSMKSTYPASCYTPSMVEELLVTPGTLDRAKKGSGGGSWGSLDIDLLECEKRKMEVEGQL